MAISPLLLQSLNPGTPEDFAKERIANQLLQTQTQSAQDELANKRRGLAVSMLNGIANEQDPAKQAALYSTIKPMAERYDPTLKLPDAYDPSLAKALTASQIPAASQAELAMKQQQIGIEQQKADQGNYEIVKDMYGNPTGFVNKKSGAFSREGIPQDSGLPPVAADGNPLTGEDYLKTLPTNHAAMVKAIGEGRMAPPSGYALTKPLGQKLMQDVSIAYPDFNANAYGAVKEFNTGKLGSTVRSLNVANDHLDTLNLYANALQNGDTKALNALSNTFSTQFGKPAPTNFDAAKQIVADEVIKAVVGAGGTGADRENAQKVIAAANSPEQLAGVIQTYKQLMRGQLMGLQQQYENSTNRKDFLDRLSAKTKQEILGESQGGQAPAGMLPGAKQAPDGNWYVPDPARPGKYLMVQP